MTGAAPFWKTKPLDAMSRAEWESLCDGCGRCCLHKLRDEDTDRVAFTEVACRLLDIGSCRCRDYRNRRDHVPDCVKLTAKRVAAIDWLPPTCAYKLVAEGRDLQWWHPLVSGDPDTVHSAGVSVRGRAVPEREAGALEDHVVRWPARVPRAATAPPPWRSEALPPEGDAAPVPATVTPAPSPLGADADRPRAGAPEPAAAGHPSLRHDEPPPHRPAPAPVRAAATGARSQLA